MMATGLHGGVLAALTSGLVLAGGPALAGFGPGAPGVGDEYFPTAGNGGYDVRHYNLGIRFDPPHADPPPGEEFTGDFDGVARISARATENLSSFNLDLRDFTVRSVTVDGKPARYTHNTQEPFDQELTVQPRPKLHDGERFTVVVRYGGKSGQPTDIEGFLYGFVTMKDGAFVANEPEGASTWYPVNDHPTDKATYDFRLTVPKGKTAVANGRLAGKRTSHGWTTFWWHAPELMASYLSTAAVGDYKLNTYRTKDGLPITDAVDRDLTPEQKSKLAERLAKQPRMIAFLSRLVGEYPFRSFGSIVDDDEDAGYALETQTKPIYSGPPDELTILHELAHMWFGDSVSPRRWQDIWLNEGFATYTEWLWTERTGGITPAEQFDKLYARPPSASFWSPPTGDPGAKHLFVSSVYTKGAMTLQALREKIGDRAFFATLRAWYAQYRDGNASTPDLIRVAERKSGQQLDRFFHVWLYEEGKPTSW